MPSTKNKIGLQFSGFQEMIEKLDKLEGDIRATTEQALRESKQYVTDNLLAVTVKANFPAHGKFSTGRVRESIDKSDYVLWEGLKASVSVGYDMKISGPVSIFLMYGTPRMAKVQSMFDAIYGSQTTKKIKEIQKEVFANAIKEKMEGK